MAGVNALLGRDIRSPVGHQLVPVEIENERRRGFSPRFAAQPTHIKRLSRGDISDRKSQVKQDSRGRHRTVRRFLEQKIPQIGAQGLRPEEEAKFLGTVVARIVL
jgi:hypothetical protein